MILGNSFTDLTFIECCHMPGTVSVLGGKLMSKKHWTPLPRCSQTRTSLSHLGSLSKLSLSTQPRLTGLGASLQCDLASDFEKEFQ